MGNREEISRHDMDADEARRKLQEGGVMLCIGVPQGTELHCDMAGLVVGPKFRGIKMLPPGLHLFCWDAGHVRPRPSARVAP
jgi:A1 cistron-splicing factor AAR2